MDLLVVNQRLTTKDDSALYRGLHRRAAYLTDYIRDVHIMRRGTDILELFPGKNVKGDHMDLGVTVLPGFGR